MGLPIPLAPNLNATVMADSAAFNASSALYKRATSNDDEDGDGDSEDWRKLDDLASRRRIQNRISQRKRRRRLKEEGQQDQNQSETHQISRSTSPSRSNSIAQPASPISRRTPPVTAQDEENPNAPFLMQAAYCMSSIPSTSYFPSTSSSSSSNSTSSLRTSKRSHGSSSSISSHIGSPPLPTGRSKRNIGDIIPWESSSRQFGSASSGNQFPDLDPCLEDMFVTDNMDESELTGMFDEFGIFKPARLSRSPSYVSDYSGHCNGAASEFFDDVSDFSRLTQPPTSFDISCDAFEMSSTQGLNTLSTTNISIAQTIDPSLSYTSSFQQHPSTGSENSAATSPPYRLDPSGSTPLHLAASAGHMGVVKILCESGMSVNSLNSEGSTPLHLAILSRNLPMVAFLISSGADCNLKNAQGQNALHLAVEQGSVELVEKTIEGIHDVQERDVAGRSALHIAAQCGFEDVVRCIVMADVN